jgi:DNA replication protein DnaC
MDSHTMVIAMDRIKEAETPRNARLWTTSRNVELWDPRAPLARDAGNEAAVFHTESGERNWFILCGEVGRGKTAWASGCFNDMIVKKVSKNENWGSNRCPKWVTEAGLFRRAEASSKAGYHGRAIYLGSLIQCPILLLDDLGGNRRQLTDWQGGAMRDLLSERHANLRPTMITTNLETWDDLEKRYGDHIVSRLIEACGFMIRMDGPDRRTNVK